VQHCPVCGTFHFPPKEMCPQCQATTLEWVPASGKGVVHSYTVTRQALHPSLEGKLPHVVILVELEEGVRMTSNIVDCEPEQVRIEMPVEVVFHTVNEEVTLPLFRPTGGG